jgi:hypothetical protein
MLRSSAGALHYLSPVAGACEPNRCDRNVAFATENYARGDHIGSVCAVRGVLHEPTVEMGLPVGGTVSFGGGVLYLSQLGVRGKQNGTDFR